jgi:hypothetical protein
MGWAEALSPEAQLAELKLRQADACDEFVAAELELRAAVRRRNRALDLLKDLRWSVKQLAAQHGLPVPESRFSRFLDADLDE